MASRISLLALLALGAVIAAAGCGGSSSKSYDAGATRSCLTDKGYGISTDWEQIFAPAQNAPKSYLVKLQNTEVSLGFFKSSGAAHDTLTGTGLVFGPDAAYLRGNVLVAWNDKPTDAERSSVEQCLTAAS